MRSHNALATMVNKSPINKLPVRLYNMQLIRFGSPVRRWTSLFFVFSGNTLVCFSPRASVSVQWVHKSKVDKLHQPQHGFTGEEEQIVWIKSPICPVDCPKTSPPLTVMGQEEGSVRPDWRAAVQRKPRAKRKNLQEGCAQHLIGRHAAS